jgi:hypothetical protein
MEQSEKKTLRLNYYISDLDYLGEVRDQHNLTGITDAISKVIEEHKQLARHPEHCSKVRHRSATTN